MARRLFTYVILIFFTGLLNIYAEDEFPPDSVWNLDDLQPESYDFEPDYKLYYSHGWFAIPHAGEYSLAVPLNFGDVYDAAREIRPSAFYRSPVGFSDRNPYSKDERKMKKEFSENNENYPETGYFSLGLSGTLNTGLPLVLRGNLLLAWQNGLLFSPYPSYNYLERDGTIDGIKQAGVAHINELMLYGSFGVMLPFYGAFIKTEETSLESFYYLYLGASGGFAASSEFTQYIQIMSPKNKIRFSNGTDTLQLHDAIKLKNLNEFRVYGDIGLGFNFSANGAGFRWELFASVPISRVVSDAEWKQYLVGLRVSIILTPAIKRIFY